MRTWVRRVRLWLGVLLLAVGVLGCTAGMFVHAYARWGGLEQLTEVVPSATVVRVPDKSLSVAALNGLFGFGATSLSPRSGTDGPARLLCWDFISDLQTGFPPRAALATGYLRADYRGWCDWEIAGLSLNWEDDPRPDGRVESSLWLQVPAYLVCIVGLALCSSPLRAVIVKRRRGKRGECLACGYDRRSLAADQPCPECGAGGPKGSIANGQMST